MSPTTPPWVWRWHSPHRATDSSTGLSRLGVSQGRAGDGQFSPNELRRFLDAGVQSWGAEPVALSVATSFVLWVLAAVNSGLAAWMLAVYSGLASCVGLACQIATLGGHQALLLALSSACAVSLLCCAVVTRCLSRAGAGPLMVIVVAALSGAAAMLGVIALLVIAVLTLVFAFVVLFVIASVI